VAPRDRPDEAESEAVSRGAAAALETDKPVKHYFTIRLCDTWAAIGDLEGGAPIGTFDPHLNFPAIGIFQRVVE